MILTYWITVAAAACIFFNGLFGAINMMTHATRNTIRLAWILLTSGALCLLFAKCLANGLFEHEGHMMLLIGIALLTFYERRRH